MTEGNDEFLKTTSQATTVHHRCSRKSDTTQTTSTNNNNNKDDCSMKESVSEAFKPRIRWPDLIAQLFIHLGCLYGFYLAIFQAKFYTVLFGKY